MNEIEVATQEISKKNIRAFGSLIEIEGKSANFASGVFSYWDALDVVETSGQVSFGMVESYPGPLVAVNLERHTRTAETLIPMDGDITLILGKATSGTTADLESVAAFRVPLGKAVTLKPGTWHYVPLSGDKVVKTMVVFRAGTPDDDLLVDDFEQTRHLIIRAET
ncbi:MAG TPA: ureidoglycolate lyase [Spirochaetia bacterium]|nr:ureidoglycolate lyase [Spirochaetia bacterium]